MFEQIFRSAGLSEKESKVYLALLQYGSRPTSFIAKKAQLNRGNAYVVLHSLLAKSLVTKASRRGIQYFAPLQPQALLSRLERRKEKLVAVQTELESVLPQLQQMMNPLASKPAVQYFEGREGARTVLEMTLSAEDKLLRAYLSLLDVSEFLGAKYFHDYTVRRIKLGYALHAIRTREKDRAAFHTDATTRFYVSSRRDRREVRYLPEDLSFPVTLYLFDNMTAIISSKEEAFSLIVESREFSEMQKKLFEALWRQSAI